MTSQTVELWAVDLPLSPPVGTPLGELREMYVLAARVGDGAGEHGSAYASFPDPSRRDATVAAALRLVEACAEAQVADYTAIEDIEAWGGAGPSGECTRAAAHAVGMATWDLLGRHTAVRCAELWNPDPQDRVACYGSGLFLSTGPDQLAHEAEAFRDENFPGVKMRVGQDPDVDLQRLAVVQAVYPAAQSVAADAFCSWSPTDADRFLQGVTIPLAWLEDPTDEEHLALVARTSTPLASGERCATSDEALELADANMASAQDPAFLVLLDVQALGGPRRFTAAAQQLRRRGVTVGSHVFAYESVHLLAALDRCSPVEVLPWWDALYETVPRPSADGALRVAGPGVGRDHRTRDASALRPPNRRRDRGTMMDQPEGLRRQLHGAQLWLELDRPHVGNALTVQHHEVLTGWLEEASATPEIRVVVLTGAGDRFFCTGADLSVSTPRTTPTDEPAPVSRPHGSVANAIRTSWQRSISAILDSDKPVIAAVNGAAAGAGCHLALAADLVIAVEEARFIEAFVRRGIGPDAGGAWLLTRLVGWRRAKELLFFGDDLDAATALEWGLINKVVPAGELRSATEAWAARLASGPTRAIGTAKMLVNRAVDDGREASFWQEAWAQEALSHSTDAQEGLRAFVEGRSPEYRGE